MYADSTFSRVVFPLPVPPVIRMFRRFFTALERNSNMSASSAPRATNSSALRGSAANLRIESSGPSTAMGGMTAFTREPSGNRQSTIGEDSSIRRPAWATIFWMIRVRCWLSLKRSPVFWSRPLRSTCTRLGVVTRMSEIVGSCSRGSRGPSPNTSSRTSSVSRSRVDSSRPPSSSCTSAATAERTSFRIRGASISARRSRLMRSSRRRWSRCLSSMYPAGAGDAGSAAAGVVVWSGRSVGILGAAMEYLRLVRGLLEPGSQPSRRVRIQIRAHPRSDSGVRSE